jgi:hypothetical protein
VCHELAIDEHAWAVAGGATDGVTRGMGDEAAAATTHAARRFVLLFNAITSRYEMSRLSLACYSHGICACLYAPARRRAACVQMLGDRATSVIICNTCADALSIYICVSRFSVLRGGSAQRQQQRQFVDRIQQPLLRSFRGVVTAKAKVHDHVQHPDFGGHAQVGSPASKLAVSFECVCTVIARLCSLASFTVHSCSTGVRHLKSTEGPSRRHAPEVSECAHTCLPLVSVFGFLKTSCRIASHCG